MATQHQLFCAARWQRACHAFIHVSLATFLVALPASLHAEYIPISVLDLGLGGTGSLSGSIYVDKNGTRLMDAADWAIRGAKISLVDANTNTVLGSVLTDQFGAYHFNGLTAGNYTIVMATPSQVSSQDLGTWRTILADGGATLINQGTSGTPSPTAYSNVVLADNQAGYNFNFAQTAYPVALATKRSLLSNSSTTNVAGDAYAPVQSITTKDALLRVGNSTNVSLTVTNIGNGNLSGAGDPSNLHGSVGSSSGLFNGPGGVINLPDGNSKTFSYAYNATVRSEDSTLINVDFNNGSADGLNHPENVDVKLNAHAVGPVYHSVLAPDSTFAFGTVTKGIPAILNLIISNITPDPNGGDSTLTDLTLKSITLAGADAALFEIVGFTPGDVIAKGGSQTLQVKYLGTGTLGDKVAEFTILTDEGVAYGANGNSYHYLISATIVPEPSMFALLGTGILGAALCFRRRRKQA